MTGAEHYKEAEGILAALDSLSPSVQDTLGRDMLARAQVHATLALAAATVEADYPWREVAS